MRFVWSFLLAVNLSGCGTISSVVANHHPDSFGPYSGVIRDCHLITSEGVPPWSSYRTNRTIERLRKLLILDLPLSFVLDTVLLPVSIPAGLLK